MVHRIVFKAVEAAFAESGQCVDDRVVSSKIEDEDTKVILSPSDATQHYDLLNGLVLFNRMTHCNGALENRHALWDLVEDGFDIFRRPERIL